MPNQLQANDLRQRLNDLDQRAISEILSAASNAELNQLRVKYLSKKGEVTSILRSMSSIESELRPEIGSLANALRTKIERALEQRQADILEEQLRSEREAFDPTVPPRRSLAGSLHPVTIVRRELEEIFRGMGFTVVDGPELETDYYNFEALNTPRTHPARDMQDTYWVSENLLLRTQTSACQVRAMEKLGAPLRVIAPGRCFRNEDIDASHENTFFQLEGLLVDRNVSIANLIYVMKTMLSEVFRTDVTVRLRPGYFPFVEPGFELDSQCLICAGQGCSTCKKTGWIELVPCGMVHPNVLRYGGVDPEEFSGFAFGLGLTRLVMMKYGISDIRVLNSGDLRSLSQFGIADAGSA
jgi:phenylalanyl-tRNA synthetase alpha chain